MKIWKLLYALPLALLLFVALRQPVSAQDLEEMSTPVPPSVQVAEFSAPMVITPTEQPTEEPTKGPTEQPTEVPTEEPTVTPTPVPTPSCVETGNCGAFFPIVSPGSWVPKLICSILIKDDPRYSRCAQDMIEGSWLSGIIKSLFTSAYDGEYTIELEGSTDEDVQEERHAEAAALVHDDCELIFRFQSFNFDNEHGEGASFQFHNGMRWVCDESTIVLRELGSYEPKEENEAAFEVKVVGQDEQTITWDESQVGTVITLTDESAITVGTFSDYRNKSTPAFIIRRGCYEVVAVREVTGSWIVPHAAKLVVSPITDCRLKKAPTGFLAPLLAGEDKPGDPNEFRREDYFDGVTAQSRQNDVRFVVKKVED